MANTTPLQQQAHRLIFWSALAGIILFILFTVCFIGIFLTQELYVWDDLSGYLRHVNATDSSLKVIAQASMLLFSMFWVVLVVGLEAVTDDSNKVLARLGVAFGLGFAILSSAHYFIQISTIPLAIEQGNLEGLANFIQANPSSHLLGMNMVAWTFFLGLSSGFISFSLRGNRARLAARAGFIANSITCLVGGFAFIFNSIWLIFITMNFLLGAIMIYIFISLLIGFGRS